VSEQITPQPSTTNRILLGAQRWLPSGPVLGLVALLLVLMLLLSLRGQAGNFFSAGNLQDVCHSRSVTAVAALGMLLVIVSGGIDLSAGSVVALVTVVCIQVYRLVYNGPHQVLPADLAGWLREQGLLWQGTQSKLWASLATIPAGLLVGVLCGLSNGLVIARLRLTPFVATLGMMSIARGLAIWLSGRTRISFSLGARPDWVDALSRTGHPWLFFDPGVWTVFALAVAVFVLLRFSVFGRYTYAVGSNEATARLCGIAVERHKLWIYALAGLFTGWAGVLLFAHTNGGDPNAGVAFELEVIAAVVIGGAALGGGQGSVTGTLVGVLILGVLENGISFLGAPLEVKSILIGAIIVVSMGLSEWQRRRRG
jgi:ribose/xylose/arabinose/galactoside ABC-type transport system permease subunit